MDTIIFFDYKCIVEHGSGAAKGKEVESCSYTLTKQNYTEYQVLKIVVSELVKPDLKGLKSRLFERQSKKDRAKLTENLRTEVATYLDKWGDCGCIYDALIPKDFWVRELLLLSEFSCFTDAKWVRRLMQYARWDHFIVLGNSACIQQILRELAPRMKSLLWVVPDYTYTEQVESFAEDFFEEYGLVIRLHFLPEGTTYGQFQMGEENSQNPVNILDFTGEKYIPYFKPAAGSVWIDLHNMPEKAKRIRSHGLKVDYYSLTLRAKTDIIL